MYTKKKTKKNSQFLWLTKKICGKQKKHCLGLGRPQNDYQRLRKSRAGAELLVSDGLYQLCHRQIVDPRERELLVKSSIIEGLPNTSLLNQVFPFSTAYLPLSQMSRRLFITSKARSFLHSYDQIHPCPSTVPKSEGQKWGPTFLR